MARTNKMGILKKKQQQAKQKDLVGPKTRTNEGMKRKFENPKGNEYERFMRSGKWINDMTSGREDPDGFRIKRQASGGDVEFVQYGTQSRSFRRRLKKGRKQKK